jgi:predicted O-linked N-acetylglucosamine transferase (SPINDLY family)
VSIFDRFRKKPDEPAPISPDATTSLEAIRLIDQGNALEDAGNLDEALVLYQSAVALAPDLARARMNIGNIHLARGETDKAISAYCEAIEKDGTYAAAFFNVGNAYVQIGDFDNAIASYRSAIDRTPDFIAAYVALGYAYDETGRFDDAIACHRKALALQPDYVEVHCNLATSLRSKNLIEEACQEYRHAFALRPDYTEALQGLIQTSRDLGRSDILISELRSSAESTPDSPQAHLNLASALSTLHHFGEAIASYRTALGLNSDLSPSYYGIACCQQAQGRFQEAADNFRRAVELDKDFVDAHNDLGNVLLRLEEAQAAVEVFRRLIEIDPSSSVAHSNLGNALHKLGLLKEGSDCLQTAVRLNPNSAIAYNNLAGILNNLGQLDAAIANYRHAVALEPNYAQAYTNLGITLWQAGRPEESISAFEHALEINPEQVDALINLGMSYASLSKLERAVENLRRAVAIAPTDLNAQGTLIFLHNYLNDMPPENLLAEAKRFGELVTRKATNRFHTWNNTAIPERLLNIGFVSGDFWAHPVGFFLENVLTALGKSNRLRLFAYSNNHIEDDLSRRLQATCSGWRSVLGLSDKAACEVIRGDGIDILIDLSGHTLNNRLPLFAWKPAPIQASWLGYFATTGVAEIDYLIADPWTLPPSQEAYFTEKIVRLPETRLCFSPPREDVAVGPLPALANGAITFGCFNNVAKLNDSVIALWCRILNAVPKSRLCLMAAQFSEENPRHAMFQRFARFGIGAERLLLKIGAPRKEYLAAYNGIDIGLDPFPYTGGTTTVESLWMGVPVLTLAGEQFLSRQGLGLLMNAGLPEWVSHSEDEYLQRAISHANDMAALSSLRQRLRPQVLNSPVFDASRFAQHFETLIANLWKTWCAKNQTA